MEKYQKPTPPVMLIYIHTHTHYPLVPFRILKQLPVNYKEGESLAKQRGLPFSVHPTNLNYFLIY